MVGNPAGAAICGIGKGTKGVRAGGARISAQASEAMPETSKKHLKIEKYFCIYSHFSNRDGPTVAFQFCLHEWNEV